MNLNTLTLLAQESTAEASKVTAFQSHRAMAIGLWVAVAFTLAIYTFLYKDNPVFKFAEHVFVGVSNGYLLWQAWDQTVKPTLVMPLIHAWRAQVNYRLWHAFHRAAPWSPPALEPNESLWLIVPAVLCLFLFLRFIPRLAWLSRWSFAFYVGAAAGNMIPLQIVAYILRPMDFHLRNGIIAHDDAGHFAPMGSINLLLTLVGVCAVLTYFLFSIEHRGAVRSVSRAGVLFLMVGFGASFGYTVMARESLLIGKVQGLIAASKAEAPAEDKEGKDWDHQPPDPHHATLWLLVVVIAGVASLELLSRSTREGGGPASNTVEPPPAATG